MDHLYIQWMYAPVYSILKHQLQQWLVTSENKEEELCLKLTTQPLQCTEWEMINKLWLANQINFQSILWGAPLKWEKTNKTKIMKKLIQPKSSFRAYYAEQPQGNCSSFNFSKSLGRAVFEVLIYSSFPETINNKDPTLIWKANQSWEEQHGNALACCTFVHAKPLSLKDNREEELCFKVVIYHPSLWDTLGCSANSVFWSLQASKATGPFPPMDLRAFGP